MAFDIGPKLGIEGDKEFRDSIRQINSSIRTLGLEMDVVASKYDKSDKSAEKLSDQNKVLNKNVKAQKERLEELNKGLEASKKEYGDNDKKTKAWEQTVLKATAGLNNMERELQDNVSAMEEAEEAARASGKSYKKSGENAEESADKHKKLGSALKGIGGAVGKAAAVSIAAIGTATIAAAKAAFDLTENTREYRSDLSKLEQNAKNANSNFETMKGHLSGLTALTGETDSSIEALSNLMATGFDDKQMVGAVDALSGAVIKFPDTLKIESLADGLQETLATGKATGQFGELIERMGGNLEDFNEQLADATTEAEKQQVAMDWLANSGLSDVTDQYKEANKEMLGAAEAEFQLNDAMAGLADAVEPTIATIKGGAADVLTSLIGMVTGTEGASEDFEESLGTLVENGVGIIEDLIPVISSTAETLIPALLTGIVNALPKLATAGMKMIDAIIQSITDNLDLIIDNSLKVVMTLLKGILKSLPKLVEGALQIVIALATGIAEALPELIPAVVEAIITIVQALINNIPMLIEAALQLITGLAEGLITAMPMLIEKAPVLVKSLVDGIVGAIPMLIDTAIQLIMSLVEYLIDPENLLGLVTAAIDIIVAIGTGLIEAIPQLLSYYPQLISAMVDKFGDTDWGQVGTDIITGVAAGIKDAAGILWQAVKDAAGTALETIKVFLGIHSPSTVMRDEVGLMMGLGIAEGVKDSYQDIDAALNGISTDFSINPSFGGGRGGAGGVSNTSINHYNKYNTNHSSTFNVNIQNPNDRLEWEKKMKRVLRQQATLIAK